MWGGDASFRHSDGFVGDKVFSILGQTKWEGMDFVKIRATIGRDVIKGAWSDH